MSSGKQVNLPTQLKKIIKILLKKTGDYVNCDEAVNALNSLIFTAHYKPDRELFRWVFGAMNGAEERPTALKVYAVLNSMVDHAHKHFPKRCYLTADMQSSPRLAILLFEVVSLAFPDNANIGSDDNNTTMSSSSSTNATATATRSSSMSHAKKRSRRGDLSWDYPRDELEHGVHHPDLALKLLVKMLTHDAKRCISEGEFETSLLWRVPHLPNLDFGTGWTELLCAVVRSIATAAHQQRQQQQQRRQQDDRLRSARRLFHAMLQLSHCSSDWLTDAFAVIQTLLDLQPVQIEAVFQGRRDFCGVARRDLIHQLLVTWMDYGGSRKKEYAAIRDDFSTHALSVKLSEHVFHLTRAVQWHSGGGGGVATSPPIGRPLLALLVTQLWLDSAADAALMGDVDVHAARAGLRGFLSQLRASTRLRNRRSSGSGSGSGSGSTPTTQGAEDEDPLVLCDRADDLERVVNAALDQMNR